MRRLPAEWEPQSGIMLTWPHADTDWAERLTEVESLYARLTALITRFEAVLIVCRDGDHAERVRGLARQAGADESRLCLAIAPSNDTWARDHGPVSLVTDAGPLLLDFCFNGWGGKFQADLDTAITGQLAADGVFGGCPVEPCELVLEGGARVSEGRGPVRAAWGAPCAHCATALTNH